MENINTIQVQWAEICAQLSQTLSDRFVMRWLSKVVPDKIENNQVHLMVSSPCIRELIEQNYLSHIASLWKTKNTNIHTVSLKLNPDLKEKAPMSVQIKKETPQTVPPIQQPTESIAVIKPQSFTPSYTAITPSAVAEEIPCYLDKSHTFENFVVGKSNQFAYAAAKKIAEEDHPAFNPLYFHAGVGLGKTHLLHAIAWRIKERHPQKSVLYLSSEQFFQRFLHDLNTKNMDGFRALVRSVDVLLIDDIQFILGKQRTQEEFFHTFNALIAEQKTIILSADSMPSALQGIDEKLRTRISQGLVVDIAPADENLRLGILQGKSKEMGSDIPDDVLAFLAKSITTNVRELEGALKRVIAHAELIGNPINMDTTQEVLKDILHTYERPVKAPEIQNFVAQYYQISLEDLQSTRRDRSFARPRQIAMYLTKVLTPLSLPDIALCFKRDHTTIIHAVRTIEGLIQQDKKLAQQVNEITTKLKAGTNV